MSDCAPGPPTIIAKTECGCVTAVSDCAPGPHPCSLRQSLRQSAVRQLVRQVHRAKWHGTEVAVKFLSVGCDTGKATCNGRKTLAVARCEPPAAVGERVLAGAGEP